MIVISLQLTKPLSERHDTGAIYKKFTIRHLTELVPKVRCKTITCEKYSTNLKVYNLIDLTLFFYSSFYGINAFYIAHLTLVIVDCLRVSVFLLFLFYSDVLLIQLNTFRIN
jgi:hypothetical protein